MCEWSHYHRHVADDVHHDQSGEDGQKRRAHGRYVWQLEILSEDAICTNLHLLDVSLVGEGELLSFLQETHYQLEGTCHCVVDHRDNHGPRVCRICHQLSCLVRIFRTL